LPHWLALERLRARQAARGPLAVRELLAQFQREK
jgi:hypothetical protein